MLPRAVALLALLVPGAALIAACGSSKSNDLSGTGDFTPIHGYVSEADASDAGAGSDAAEGPALGTQVTQGNGICHASKLTGCYPDTMVDACDLPDDGGAADAATDGAAAYPAGCHVITDGTGIVRTVCLASKLQGMYASTCSQSTDCSPGWECVNEGTCRHYCCSGNSACSDNQFCDVQPTAQDPNTLVPVCVSETPCTLIDIDGCPTGEQCSVVKEDGTTSCVAVGPQGDGESCDLEHCAHGYVCLGTTGSRRCAPLCYTASVGACTNGRTCVGTLPLFTNPLVGACQ
jgi:hypothetical protein